VAALFWLKAWAQRRAGRSIQGAATLRPYGGDSLPVVGGGHGRRGGRSNAAPLRGGFIARGGEQETFQALLYFGPLT
jgi:hypothetical protein